MIRSPLASLGQTSEPKTSRRIAWVLSLLYALAVSTMVSVQDAHAQDKAEYATTGGPSRANARTLYDEGEKDFAAERYQSALAKFQDARNAYAAPTIVLRIGQCREKIRHLIEASESYLEVTRWKLSANDPAQFGQAVKDAKAALESVTPRIPKVVLTIEPRAENLKITIDDKPFATSFLGIEAAIDPGSHRVVVEAPNFERNIGTFTIGERDKKAVRMALVPGGTKSRPDLPPPVQPPDPPNDPQPAPAPEAPVLANPNVPPNNQARPEVSPIALTLGGGVGLGYVSRKSQGSDNGDRAGFTAPTSLTVGVRLGPLLLNGIYKGNYTATISTDVGNDGGSEFGSFLHGFGGQVGYITAVDRFGFWLAGEILMRTGSGEQKAFAELGVQLGLSIPMARGKLRLIPNVFFAWGSPDKGDTQTTFGAGISLHFDIGLGGPSKAPPDQVP
jgi:hypothetical protein